MVIMPHNVASLRAGCDMNMVIFSDGCLGPGSLPLCAAIYSLIAVLLLLNVTYSNLSLA